MPIIIGFYERRFPVLSFRNREFEIFAILVLEISKLEKWKKNANSQTPFSATSFHASSVECKQREERDLRSERFLERHCQPSNSSKAKVYSSKLGHWNAIARLAVVANWPLSN